jgi:hypothetical protein
MDSSDWLNDRRYHIFDQISTESKVLKFSWKAHDWPPWNAARYAVDAAALGQVGTDTLPATSHTISLHLSPRPGLLTQLASYDVASISYLPLGPGGGAVRGDARRVSNHVGGG